MEVNFKNKVVKLSQMIDMLVNLANNGMMSLTAVTISIALSYLPNAAELMMFPSIAKEDLFRMICYTFTSPQRNIGGRWYGKGLITFYYLDNVINVNVLDYKVLSLTFKKKMPEFSEVLNYIDFFLYENGFNRITKIMSYSESTNSGLTYNIINKNYDFKIPDKDELYFPANLDDTLKTLDQIIGYGQVKLNSLTKMSYIVEQEEPIQLYFTPSKYMSSINLLSSFVIKNDYNNNIIRKFTEEEITLSDVLSLQVYSKDIYCTLESLISQAHNSKIYGIIYSVGQWANETKPNFPGDPGSFSRSVIEFKDLNPSFELDLNLLYTPETLNMSRFYKGMNVNQLLLDSKKIWQTLTKPTKQKVFEDIEPLILKYKELGTVDHSSLSNVLTKWGTSVVEGGIINYAYNDSKVLLETFVYSLAFHDKTTTVFNFKELFCALYHTLIANKNVTSKRLLYRFHEDRIGWFNTILDSWLYQVNPQIGKCNANFIAYEILLEFILEDTKVSKTFNKSLKNLVNPILSKTKISKENLHLFADALFKLDNLSFYNEKLTKRDCIERLNSMNSYMTKWNYLTINYNFNETKFRIKNVRSPMSTIPMIPYKANFPKGKKFIDSKVKKDLITEIYDEFDLSEGHKDKECLEAVEEIKNYKKIWKDEVESDKYIGVVGLNEQKNSLLVSSESSRIIIFLKNTISLPHKNYRGGMWSLGYLNRQCSRVMGLGDCCNIVFVTTDDGLSVYSRFGFRSLSQSYVRTPLSFLARVGKYDNYKEFFDDFIKKKGVAETKKTIKIKQEIVDKVDFTDIKLTDYVPEESFENLMDQTLAAYTLSEVGSIPDDVTKELITTAVKKSSNLEIHQMITTPVYMSHVESKQEPPYSLCMIKNQHLRAELNSILDGLADEILTCQGRLSKAVADSVRNTCDLIESLDVDDPNIIAAIDIILSLLADVIVDDFGNQRYNNAFLNYTNKLMENVKKNRTKPPRRMPPGTPFKKQNIFIKQ